MDAQTLRNAPRAPRAGQGRAGGCPGSLRCPCCPSAPAAGLLSAGAAAHTARVTLLACYLPAEPVF